METENRIIQFERELLGTRDAAAETTGQLVSFDGGREIKAQLARLIAAAIRKLPPTPHLIRRFLEYTCYKDIPKTRRGISALHRILRRVDQCLRFFAKCSKETRTGMVPMRTTDPQTAIVDELKRQGAFSPEDAVVQHAVRQALAMPAARFDTPVAELTDRGIVGTILGALYLK